MSEARTNRFGGSVVEVRESTVRVRGLGAMARVGDRVSFEIMQPGGGAERSAVPGEIVGLEADGATAMAYRPLAGVAIGDRVWLGAAGEAGPCEAWLGLTLDAFGQPILGGAAPSGPGVDLRAEPPRALRRRRMGERLNTGHAALDTVLPICRGQRVGVFAGSGIGKSRLLAALAQRMTADVVVIGLIGERGREVRDFVEKTLGAEAMKRAVVIVATSDEPAPVKRRAAWLTLATAEYFRDRGRHVLMLFDSLTRFAEAHREVALTAGEVGSLGGYPPSTTAMIAGLAERAGPGEDRVVHPGGPVMGDITAVFSVLVAGSDMEEPVADMTRGILDGHLVLERGIAERGRFPAIDVRRSVSRALPEAANDSENMLISQARSLLAAYEQAEPMIQIGLYKPGADPQLDHAVKIWPALDAFFAESSAKPETAFGRLQAILSGAPG